MTRLTDYEFIDELGTVPVRNLDGSWGRLDTRKCVIIKFSFVEETFRNL